jgi:hypothetical protein
MNLLSLILAARVQSAPAHAAHQSLLINIPSPRSNLFPLRIFRAAAPRARTDAIARAAGFEACVSPCWASSSIQARACACSAQLLPFLPRGRREPSRPNVMPATSIARRPPSCICRQLPKRLREFLFSSDYRYRPGSCRLVATGRATRKPPAYLVLAPSAANLSRPRPGRNPASVSSFGGVPPRNSYTPA